MRWMGWVNVNEVDGCVSVNEVDGCVSINEVDGWAIYTDTSILFTLTHPIHIIYTDPPHPSHLHWPTHPPHLY